MARHRPVAASAASTLASSIATLAATRLIGILHLRTTQIGELPEASRAQHTPSAPPVRPRNRQRQPSNPTVRSPPVPSHAATARGPTIAPPSRPRKPPRDRP